MKTLAVLGATGSVGEQALDVARKNGYSVRAIGCFKSVKKAEDAVREFKIPVCAMEDENAASELRAALRDTDCRVISGKGANAKLVSETDAETVLNSVTGIAGLIPTVEIIKNKKKLALANKESLVTAGAYVMPLAEKNNVEILPVDSEHSAVWQSMRAGRKNEVKRIILTASGGPFFGYTIEQLEKVTPAQALKHPTWDMGAKITIDSATLMNKGFEVIEAAWLFGVPGDKIEVSVHRQSIIHSMVEYIDNAIVAQMGAPDMRTCIQYAITYPERIEGFVSPLDFTKMSNLTFAPPNEKTFTLLPLARKTLELGGTYGAALNGANEVAVAMFLKGEITLPRLFDIVEKATLNCGLKDTSIEAVFESDRLARAFVLEHR